MFSLGNKNKKGKNSISVWVVFSRRLVCANQRKYNNDDQLQEKGHGDQEGVILFGNKITARNISLQLV